jgi:hypothetical protein
MTAAEEAGFDGIITTDQEIQFRQNLHVRRIWILVLCGRTNRLSDLRPLAPAALLVLDSIQPGQIVRIP